MTVYCSHWQSHQRISRVKAFTVSHLSSILTSFIRRFLLLYTHIYYMCIIYYKLLKGRKDLQKILNILSLSYIQHIFYIYSYIRGWLSPLWSNMVSLIRFLLSGLALLEAYNLASYSFTRIYSLLWLYLLLPRIIADL